jgi:hypothetical protein
VEGGKQVTVILEIGVICIAITIFVNSSLFMNDPDKIDRSYSDRPSHERISNQELNTLEEYPNSGITVQTGNGTILTLQEDVHDSSLKMDEVTLIKGDGILPGADAYVPKNNPRKRHPFGHPRIRGSKSIDVLAPQNIQGLGNIPKGPKVQSFREVETGLNVRRGNRGDQCPASKFNMYEEHKNFVEEMKSKGHFVNDVDCDLERFEKLSTNPETDFIDRKSINEVKTILQSEQENLITNGRRPNLNKGEPNLDFVVDGSGSYKYVDVKKQIDPRKFPPAKEKPESFNKMAKRIGEKITKQKGGSDKVLHIVDLEQIPSEVKENIKKKLSKALEAEKILNLLTKKNKMLHTVVKI